MESIMNNDMFRREFITRGSLATAALGTLPFYAKGSENSDNAPIMAKQYLKNILYTKKEVDDWLAGKAFPFAKYSSEFGWLLPNARFRDGVDDSISTYTYGEYDERIMINYIGKPCRINTYGNSFTQCHQVSDGETWQEVLAAHLQEPIRNFGVGGWSVYQGYLRMLREERRAPAEYIIFNIYDDDHFRNLDSWRNIRVKKHVRFIEPTLPYVKVNVKEKSCVAHLNPCPTPESVYNLCDLDWVYQTLKDDFALQIMLAHLNAKTTNPSQSYIDLMNLATTHGINTRIDSNQTLEDNADKLHKEAALFSTQCIVEKIETFAKANNKKVLYVLSYPASPIAEYIEKGMRWDQPFIDFMKSKNLPFIDLLDAHVREFSQFKTGSKEYLKRYFIGHYNPLGNFFCAYAIKNKLVEMLEPKPLPYRDIPGILE